jgi:hypothetical protein
MPQVDTGCDANWLGPGLSLVEKPANRCTHRLRGLSLVGQVGQVGFGGSGGSEAIAWTSPAPV